jgi:glycine/D-amino acid oxidase-like deaminating enzyme
MASVGAATPRSLWLDRLEPPVTPRPGLGGDLDADVAIVGGGFSGLWTAYYLRQLDPRLRVIVVEREHCGYGASGRNGGWCEGAVAGSFEAYAARSTVAEARRLVRAMFATVDEVARVCQVEGIDCGLAKGGTVRLARNRPQLRRQRDEVAQRRTLGFTSDEIRLLDQTEAAAMVNATGVRGGIFLAPSAALDPARLVRGLARVVEAAGVTIVEQTRVTALGPGGVRTDRGRIRATAVVRATEAYSRDLPGARRDLIPVYSLMVATEPLEGAVFDQIGLAGRPTFADDRYLVIYGQRTEDNRIAFGGRGVPYLFGSRIDPRTELRQEAHQLIADTLAELFPVLDGAAITHRWGGVLGIPRNWLPGLSYDPRTGFGILGGYVGEGVAAANLAGRTMAELVLGADTERTSLPWVGVRSRPWEPEPLRWLGVRASRRLLMRADQREYRSDRPAALAHRLAEGLRRSR